MACLFALPLHVNLLNAWHFDPSSVALGLEVGGGGGGVLVWWGP
jgi:hypothetical protein